MIENSIQEESGDYRTELSNYLWNAIRIGKNIPETREIVKNLLKQLNKPYNKSINKKSVEHLADDVIDVFYNSFCKARHDINEIKSPKKSFLQRLTKKEASYNVNDLVPHIIKQSYTMPVMLEAIATIDKYHIEQGADTGIAIGTLIIINGDWPNLLMTVKEAKDEGANYDVDLMMRINSLFNMDTVNYLKKWWKTE